MYAKKRYGQNFLQSDHIARKIINSLNLKKDDIIIEIGPGLGALTKYLYSYENYLGIEIDSQLVEKLKLHFKGIRLKNVDFLNEDLNNYGVGANYIGNLPYYIVSSIIFKVIQNGFSKAVFMVQKEVAQRIASEPKNKSYGFLSVLAQYYCDVQYLFQVKNTSFYPVPKVHSAVVKFVRNGKLYDQNFVDFLKKSFAMKRKTLVNNLKVYYPIDDVKRIIKELEIPLNSRAEELSPEFLRKVYDALDKH